MSKLPNCPKCNSEYTYEDGNILVCPECAHEWTTEQNETANTEDIIKDANGTVLEESDSAIVVNDIKMSGSSGVIKRGTKVTKIRFEKNGPHNIVARVDGFGLMELKSELIKKSK